MCLLNMLEHIGKEKVLMKTNFKRKIIHRTRKKNSCHSGTRNEERGSREFNAQKLLRGHDKQMESSAV